MATVPQADLGLKLKRLSKLMGQRATDELEALELTSSQGFVLKYLNGRKDVPISPRDLERQFGFSHPTVCGLLRRLESKGFLTIAPSQEDRRCKRIALTDKARRMDAQMLRGMQNTERILTTGLSPEEIAQLHALLDRMIDNLNGAWKEGGDRL